MIVILGFIAAIKLPSTCSQFNELHDFMKSRMYLMVSLLIKPPLSLAYQMIKIALRGPVKFSRQ